MPSGTAATGDGESARAPDFLSESHAGDENCSAGDGFVPAAAARLNRRF